MGGGFLQRSEGQLDATLFGVWVEPVRRRTGVGRELVEGVAEWARARGAQRLRLWVTDGNSAARALYLRSGFVVARQSKVLATRLTVHEELMTPPL